MALQTFGDIKNEVLVRLDQGTTVAYYTDSMLGDWINDAYKWAAGYHRWPAFDYVDSSTTTASPSLGTDGFTYPTNFKSESIRWMRDNNSNPSRRTYDKVRFQDYIQYQNDFPTGQDQIFSDFGRTFFVNVNVASGTLYLYGSINAPFLDKSDPTGQTLFSGADEQANEAIVEKVLSYALVKQQTPVNFYKGKYVSAAIVHASQGAEILDALWKNHQDEQFAYQAKNREMFKRFSVERGALRDDLLKRDQFY